MLKITELLTYLSNPALLVIFLLAAFSITRLVTTDTFPLFEKPRNWLIEKFPPAGHRTKKRPTNKKVRWIMTADWYNITEGHWFGELISCNWCAGFWVSLGITVFAAVLPATAIILSVPFALRVAAGWIGQLT